MRVLTTASCPSPEAEYSGVNPLLVVALSATGKKGGVAKGGAGGENPGGGGGFEIIAV